MKLSLRLWALAFLSAKAVLAVSQTPLEVDELEDEIRAESQTPNIAVNVSTSFPQSEIFGVKLVNGRPTEAVLSISNNEPTAVNVRFIGGSLWTLPDLKNQSPRIVRNLSTTVYNGLIPAGEKDSFTYKFQTEMHPQDVQLNLAAVIADEKGQVYTISAFNETVGIVEAPISIFDPQIVFLYLMLAAGFTGLLYFIYNTWFTTLFPQQKRRSGGKDGSRARASLGGKKVNPADQVSVVGADGPAVTSGSKAYDESWIPADHLKRPEAKRIKSGTPTGVKTKRAL